MRARRDTLGRRIGGALLALYPERWRERYGEEVGALLEDDPPGGRGLGSLLFGAAEAHLRPRPCWQQGSTPGDSMRRSVGALFACWIVVSVAGSSFAKLTEHMDGSEHGHPVLLAARGLIVIGAVIGAASVALGGLPLLWQALRAAVRRRDVRLAVLLGAPALAAAVTVGLAALLVAAAPSGHGGFPAGFVLGTLLPLTLAVLLCALVGALVPKAVMRRAGPPVALLRLAALAGQGLTVAMLLVVAGLAVYVPALWSLGAAGAAPSGPLGLSTRITLCLSLAVALPALAAAMVASARARRAALARS